MSTPKTTIFIVSVNKNTKQIKRANAVKEFVVMPSRNEDDMNMIPWDSHWFAISNDFIVLEGSAGPNDYGLMTVSYPLESAANVFVMEITVEREHTSEMRTELTENGYDIVNVF